MRESENDLSDEICPVLPAQFDGSFVHQSHFEALHRLRNIFGGELFKFGGEGQHDAAEVRPRRGARANLEVTCHCSVGSILFN